MTDAAGPQVRAARALKRVIDLLVSTFGLLALSPVFALLVLLELVFHGWPPTFTQKRPGLHGRIFRMRKFRSMTNARGPDGELLPDEQRLTPFGRFIRRTSLDELPGLWNVLVGDMSLVGPRPLLPRYLDRYSPEQARRHDVVPGITGWAQVNGRNAISWDQKFALDVWYVDNWSLWLDLRILVMTAAKVLRRDGISHAGSDTMPEFLGSGPTNEHQS